MAETTSAPSLRELSEAVPRCEWKASGRYIGTANHMSLIGECRDENGNWSDTKTSKAKAAFVARLASDYFANRLIDPTTLSEAVASARAESVREGLETAARLFEARCTAKRGELADNASTDVRRQLDLHHEMRAAEQAASAIRALVPAPPTGSRAETPPWLHPDSGPRNRTPVILAAQARTDCRIVVGEGYFDPEDGDGKWWWAGESRGDYNADAIETYFGIVIGWMPLPAPPTTPGGRTDG